MCEIVWKEGTQLLRCFCFRLLTLRYKIETVALNFHALMWLASKRNFIIKSSSATTILRRASVYSLSYKFLTHLLSSPCFFLGNCCSQPPAPHCPTQGTCAVLSATPCCCCEASHSPAVTHTVLASFSYPVAGTHTRRVMLAAPGYQHQVSSLLPKSHGHIAWRACCKWPAAL